MPSQNSLKKKEKNRINHSRLIINRLIINEISKFIEKYPDLRFCQALDDLNIVQTGDYFYTESEETYKSITQKLESLNQQRENK